MSAKMVDLSDKQFGCLKVTNSSERRQSGSGWRQFWLCRCICGKEKWVRSSSLVNGDTRSCGCKKSSVIAKKARERIRGRPPIRNLSGMQFGRLRVTTDYQRVISGSKAVTKWKCICGCGKERWVQSSSLLHAKKPTRSCGCLAKELASQANRLPSGMAAQNCVYSGYKLRAKRKNLLFDISLEEFYSLTQTRCNYCGVEPANSYSTEDRNGSFCYNGIDRVDNTKGYIKGNCVACCKVCNRAKDILTKDEFKDWIARTYSWIFRGSLI